MNAPILHHYPVSPFAEKIRAMLAFKKIAWQSVRIPMVMPKPDLVALTGGYRRTPVLQTGADIWCDTALIARMAALGNGDSTEISPERALEIAKGAQPEAIARPEAVETGGIALGDAVAVMPVDYALDPVKGELLNCSASEIAVRRTDPRAGTVVVHFPRFGFQVARA
jgi:hypothetical protein